MWSCSKANKRYGKLTMAKVEVFLLVLAAFGIESLSDTWHQHGPSNKQYAVIPIKSSFTITAARTMCIQLGGALPEPRGSGENTFTEKLALNNSISKYWIDINDIQIEGTFVLRSDNAPVKFFDWYPGNPDNGVETESRRSEDCVAVISADGWIDLYCEESLYENGIVCEKCVDRYFRGNCSSPCNCEDNCDRMDGKCPSSCTSGWRGLSCQQACADGKFGQNCIKDCHCKVACDKTTGRCPSHCLPGWRGDDCQNECPDGKFGQNCAKDCHCEDVCDKGTGICPSKCWKGWQGDDCQTGCPDGTFGSDCARDCHCKVACDKTTGRCSSDCLSGWLGHDCQKECADNRWGPYCSRYCNCKDVCNKSSGRCPSECVFGWLGDACQIDCRPRRCGDHRCERLGNDVTCVCLPGYENTSPLQCEDIDECKLQDICDSHECVNSNGSYECRCKGGFTNIALQVCVEDDDDVLTGKSEPEDSDTLFSLSLKEITTHKIMVMGLETAVIVFFAITVISCAKTIGIATYLFATTLPMKNQQSRMLKNHFIRITYHEEEESETNSESGSDETVVGMQFDDEKEEQQKEDNEINNDGKSTHSFFYFPLSWASSVFLGTSVFYEDEDINIYEDEDD